MFYRRSDINRMQILIRTDVPTAASPAVALFYDFLPIVFTSRVCLVVHIAQYEWEQLARVNNAWIKLVQWHEYSPFHMENVLLQSLK